MTVRELFEAVLIEQNKIEAPSLQLVQYNYFMNKAVNDVLDEIYNMYDLDQQRTDDFYALTRTINYTFLGGTANVSKETGSVIEAYPTPSIPLFNTREGIKFNLPINYWHLLSVILYMRSTTNNKWCGDGDVVHFEVKRLTEDMFMAITRNYYNKPAATRPYYLITDNPLPGINNVLSNNVTNVNNAEIEILTGNRHPNFEFDGARISYLKTPQVINLTYNQAFDDIVPGSPLDTSQVLEFPNNLCHRIINRCAMLVANNANDPKTQNIAQTRPPVAPPGQTGAQR